QMAAILTDAVTNKVDSSNATEKAAVDIRDKQGERKQSFTNEEAKTILRAALSENDPFKRWVPWIGAYTGARLSEICQLRREDVLQTDGIWCVKFLAEAGQLKNRNSERAVPLHPALVKSGLLEFVAASKPGPLFCNLTPD